MKPTVLITGANRGLGLALAEEFNQQGYNLILHARKPVSWLGEQPLPFRVAKAILTGDLNDQANFYGWLKKIRNLTVNVLVNNAGIYLNKSFKDISPADIWEVMETNFISPVALMSAFYPSPMRTGLRLVVNINSLASLAGGPGESIYAASKAALAAFSETVQKDVLKDGIRVLNVNLGAMNTDMTNGRPEQEKFIHIKDAAQAIVGLCLDYMTLRITSVDIKRSLY